MSLDTLISCLLGKPFYIYLIEGGGDSVADPRYTGGDGFRIFRDFLMNCIIVITYYVPATTTQPKKKFSHNVEMNNKGHSMKIIAGLCHVE